MNKSLLLLSMALLVTGVQGQSAERPPATPLVAHNPYFSLWSETDKLTDSPTRHWTGHPQQLRSLVRIDGKTFRIMGDEPGSIPPLTQTSQQLTPLHTRYKFTNGAVEIELTFFTPAFLQDLEVLSRPVTYLTWTAHSTDGSNHDVAVYLDANADLATSYEGQPVTFSRNETASANVLSVGTRDQAVLNRSGDNLRIDWGYFHLVVPKGEQSSSTIAPEPAQMFAQTGVLAGPDVMNGVVSSNRFAPKLAVALPLGTVGNSPVSRELLVSYTEEYAIQLMGRNLRPYWERNGKPVGTMLDEALRDASPLEAKGIAFDRQLTEDLTRSAGKEYAWLCTLAYRQAIAAHVLVASEDGAPLLFAKENFSNGDIATVDVLYPSAPLFLFFNPRLLEAQVTPVLQYAAASNHWHFPFAPHDLGQYPLANGQEYGGGEKTEENQMPVEESGNLVLMVDAIARTEGTPALAERFWPLLTQWAGYLETHGLDPERQLTTDDFAGHVAHNANLSIKAIDALEAYADLAKLLHHPEIAQHYDKTARDYAARWVTLAKEGDHYKLGFDTPNSWSQKYNLVWDKLLGYSLFPPTVRQAEVAFYLKKLNRYGLPLDSRKTYTKLDWEMWTATLADSPADFQTFIAPLYRWANDTNSRVPMTDWYDTVSGLQVGFQARSVVGGLFIKALDDRPLAARWRSIGLAGPQSAKTTAADPN